MVPNSICFVDIETSGINAAYNKIIEIGVIKTIDGKIVKEFKTLVNPNTYIDPFIENMTGIKTKDLQNAPTFYDIKDELLEILNGCAFAAHSVRFDYGFIRNEFKKTGISFSSKHFCTVKLARLLYPNLRRYNLDSIIENFNITCLNRHRAYDDARVIYEFFQLSQKNIKKQVFEQAVGIALKKPTIPSNLSEEDLEKIPEAPGAYTFYGDENTILYIGKSINLRERVMSHFSNDHLSSTDMKISRQIKSIEATETAGELGALLLESTLIKKNQPLFNRLLRDARKMLVLLKTKDKNGYSTVSQDTLDNVEIDRISDVLGIFKSNKQAKEFLYTVAKEYKLCPKILGLDKSSKYCFYYHLGQCLGACAKLEFNLKYNLRFDEAFYKSKIKQWNFDTPILIKEKGNKEEVHIVDKWCYLGSIKNEADTLKEIIHEYRFDIDTYKILARYILNPKNQKNIKPYKLLNLN